MCPSQIFKVGEYMNKLKELIKEQLDYAVCHGGCLSIPESDNTYNDYNRKIIAEFNRVYKGKCFIGSVNHYGMDRIGIINGSIPVYKQYDGSTIYNFGCDFIVPVKDKTLECYIREWNENSNSCLINAIQRRIDKLGGIMFLWY